MELTSYFDDDENVLLLNSQYVKPMLIDEASRKWSDGVLYLTYRDLNNNEKYVRKIVNPKSDIFITKPDHRTDFKTQREFVSNDIVDRYTIPYSKITSFIMNEIRNDGRDIEYLDACKLSPKEAFKWRHSYFADYNISDYAMISYILSKQPSRTEISKAYLDIESDVYGYTSSEMNNAETPINAVSVVVPYNDKGELYKHPKVFTFLLRNHIRYKQQEYFENHLDEFIEECHEEFDEKYNTPQFIIRIFDNEIDMLRMLFSMLHKVRPDFILIWNMSYDIPTIIKRLTYLGEDPANYFCHPDFDVPYYRYNYDLIYKNDFKNKCESFDCTSYSIWGDQMLNYAGVNLLAHSQCELCLKPFELLGKPKALIPYHRLRK